MCDPGHCGQPGLGSPWAAGAWWVLQVSALVAPLAAPCWLQVQRLGSASVQRGWGGHRAGRLGAGTPLPCQACHPLPHPPAPCNPSCTPCMPPSLPPVPSPHSQAPSPPCAPLPRDLVAGAAQPSPSTSPQGDAAASSREQPRMPGWAMRQLLGLGAPQGGAFPMALPWECFSCLWWEPDLENSKSISTGSLGAATPPGSTLAPLPTACRELGCAAPEQPGQAGLRGAGWAGRSCGDTAGCRAPCWAHCSHSPQQHCPASAAPTRTGEFGPHRAWSQRSSNHGLRGAMSPGRCRGSSQSAATHCISFPSSPGCGEAPVPQCPKPGSPKGALTLHLLHALSLGTGLSELGGILQRGVPLSPPWLCPSMSQGFPWQSWDGTC